MWKRILKFYLFFLWFWSNLNCQCTGAKKKKVKVKVNPTTPDIEADDAVMIDEKRARETFFEAADLSKDVDSGNHVLRSAPVSTVLSCALECLRDSDCKSILVKKYHEMTGKSKPYECYLVSGRSFHGLTDASTANELLYFVRKDVNDLYKSTNLT